MTSRYEATHARIQECALDLFATRGYDGTTVNDIAAAAGVSHMTFFRHFPTKESVVLDDPFDPVVGEEVAATATTLPAVDRVVAGLLAAWSRAADDPQGRGGDERIRVRVAIAAGVPALRAGMVQNVQATQDVLVDALERSGVARAEAVAAAGAVLGAITATLLDWALQEDAPPFGTALRSALAVLSPTLVGAP